MIGVIITGHGMFAEGMYEAVRLLAGKPEAFLQVGYLQEDSADDYELKLKEAIQSQKDCSGTLILCDLMMAMPYKLAVRLKKKFDGQYPVEVVAGANLGMVTQVNLARGYMNNLQDLVELAVEEGRKQIVRYREEEE